MATITPVAASKTAANQTLAAATTGGDTIATHPNARCLFIVNNGGGASITVTFAGAVPCDQGGTHPGTATVPAGQLAEIPVPAHCIDPTTGHVAATYSAVTSVTVGAVVN